MKNLTVPFWQSYQIEYCTLKQIYICKCDDNVVYDNGDECLMNKNI